MISRVPLIGLTGHLLGQPDGRGRERVFNRLDAQYLRAIVAAGGLPVVLPAHPDFSGPAETAVTVLHGLFLTGGSEASGARFRQSPGLSLRETDPDRYDYEAALVRAAWARGLPLLGVCRGHQTMVEALGGRLIRNIAQDRPGALNHHQAAPPEEPSHGLKTAEGSKLFTWLGPSARVNSFHGQAVATPPPGFQAAAWAEDGLVEAVESEEPFGLGLQFHPEWLYSRDIRFLNPFLAFIDRCRGRMVSGRARDVED